MKDPIGKAACRYLHLIPCEMGMVECKKGPEATSHCSSPLSSHADVPGLSGRGTPY